MPTRADTQSIPTAPTALPCPWQPIYARGVTVALPLLWRRIGAGEAVSVSHLPKAFSRRSKRRGRPKSREPAVRTRVVEKKGVRSPDASLSRRWAGIILIAVCCVSVLVGVLAFDSLPSLIGDNAEFMILARSLAAGNGFRYMNHPDNRPATKYPVGFPALLAGWTGLFGGSVVSMKACVMVCYVAVAGLTFLLAGRLIGWSYGLLASLLVALSAAVVSYSHQVLSDVPYMLFSLAAIYLLLSGFRQRRYLLAGLGICIWAFVVRTAGMSLVLAVTVFLYLKGMKKQALVALGVAALVAILWSVRNYLMTGEGSRYMEVLLSANPYDPDKGALNFAGLVNRIVTNAGGYLGGLLPVTVLPTLVRPDASGGTGGLTVLISVLTMIVAVLGGYSLRKKALLVNIYLLLYFGLYLLWPEVWKSERFMVPIVPLIAIYLVWGLRTILAYFDVPRVATVAVCAALVATNLVSLSDFVTRERGYPSGWARYLETAEWAGANTDPTSVVMCRKPFLFHLFSDRKTIGYPFTRDREAMRDHLFEARPDLIVLDDFGRGGSATDVYVVPVLQELVEYLSLAYETEEPVNKLLRFRPPEGVRER
jgi:hypothetical protein